MNDSPMRPYDEFVRRSPAEMQRLAEELRDVMATRRTVREFSSQPVPSHVVASCLEIAATAPSGANQQPWTFVRVQSPTLRQEIREAAEAEERAFYGGRASQEWLDALQPFQTDASKPFLESAPELIAIFARAWLPRDDGTRQKTYYAAESVGIATGFLIAALHQCGVASLTHTPAPMKFLNRILNRPDNERPYLLLAAGFPPDECRVPTVTRRPTDEVIISM